jgi:uncharacterized membrane-anchored protein YitT (DUF2179 family)
MAIEIQKGQRGLSKFVSLSESITLSLLVVICGRSCLFIGLGHLFDQFSLGSTLISGCLWAYIYVGCPPFTCFCLCSNLPLFPLPYCIKIFFLKKTTST